MRTDAGLYHAACAVLAFGVALLTLLAVFERLARGRDLHGLRPFIVGAFVLRAAIIVAITNAGALGATIRGTDDPAFLYSARLLADHPISSGAWPDALRGDGLTFVSGALVKIFGDPGGDALRLLQAAVGALAVLLVVVAVHDLKGRASAGLTGALLLVEPTSLFFTTILQKESFLLLSVGLAAFAVGSLWKGGGRLFVANAVGAIVVAATVRPYAAGFLAAGLLACVLQWTVMRVHRRRLAIVAGLLTAATVAVVGLFASGTATRLLDHLQLFQTIETDSDAALSLRPVDFTTVSGALHAVPERIVDFVVRPAPWQLSNNEQRLGAVGTLITWALILWLLVGLVRHRGKALAAAPLVLLMVPVAVGYAVTSANAGTGFRHRIHVVVLVVASCAIVWADSPGAMRGRAAANRLAERVRATRGSKRSTEGSAIAAGGTWVALRYAMVGVLNLGGSVYLIRRLGPEVWATYTVAFFIASFFDQQVGTKILGSLIGADDEPSRNQVGAIAVVSVGAGIGILGVLLAARGPLGDSTDLPGLTACLAASGACAVILSIRAPATALLERGLRFRWIAAAEILDQITFFAIAIPLALANHPTTALALGLLCRAIPGAVLVLAAAQPRVGRPTRGDVRAAVGFGAPVLAVAALVLVEGLIPFVTLGGSDARGLGWVNTAASVVGYAAVVMLVMQRITFAGLSDARRRSGSLHVQTRRVAESAVLLLLTMLMPTALAEGWVPLLFGNSWNGAGTTFAVMGVAYLLMGPVVVIGGALYASGAPSRVLVVYLAMDIVYVGAIISGAVPESAIGVTAAYAVSRLAGGVVSVYLVRPFVAMRALALAVGMAATGGSGIALVAWAVDGGPVAAAGVGAVAALASLSILLKRQGRWLLGHAARFVPGVGPETDVAVSTVPTVAPPG